MFFNSTKVLGLDIGTSTIKLAELDVSRRGGTLTGFSLASTPDQSVVGGDIADPIPLSEALIQLIQDLNSKRKKIAAGLWGTSVIVKKISIPKMDEKMVGEQIRWEAEQYIPFEIDEVQIEFEILKNSNMSAETMDILLVAARTESVFKYAEIISTAGLECSVLDVGGFALANCFIQNYKTGVGHNQVLLNMGASVTNVVAIENGEIVFCRDVPVGGLTYSTEIQKGMSISLDEADSMKLSVSSGEPAPDEVSQILEKTHDLIAEEIQGSLHFYLNTSAGSGIDRVYVSGGGAKVSGVQTVLGSVLNLQVEKLNPFRKIGFDSKKFNAQFISEIEDFAAVAVGLGLRRAGDS